MMICQCTNTVYKQKGMVSLLFIAISIVLLLTSILGIDAIRLQSEKQRLQNIADLTVLEITTRSKILGGRAIYDPEILALEALSRHGFDLEDESHSMSVDMGRMELTNDGRLHFYSPAHAEEYVNAIQLQLNKKIPTFLLNGINQLLGGKYDYWTLLHVNAVAMQTSTSSFSFGSGLASVNPANSPLLNLVFNELLQTDLDLDLVSFRGVLDTSLSLLELSHDLMLLGVDLSLISVDELLNASIDIASVIKLTALIAERENASVFDIEKLQQIALQTPIRNTEVRLDQVFNLVEGLGALDDQMLESRFSYFEFLNSILLSANKDRAIQIQINDVSFLNQLTSILGIDVDLKLELDIISPPQIAIGPPGLYSYDDVIWNTEATTAQLGVLVGATLGLPLSLIELDLGISVSAAGGKAVLNMLDFEQSAADFLVYPSLAMVKLGSFESSAQLPAVVKVELLGLPVAEIAVSALLGSNLDEKHEINFNIDFDEVGQNYKDASPLIGSVGSLIGTLENTNIQIKLLGVELGLVNSLLNPIVAELAGVLNPLLQFIGGQIVDPLLAYLGVGTMVTEVQLIDVNYSSVELVR